MRFSLSLAALLLLSPACAGPGPAPPPRPSPDTTLRLLAPVYFYQGHTVGRANRTTGLQVREGDGFRRLTWPELITNSVSVGPAGRWIYLAAGNGVLVSRDAGRTWVLTGGWRMAEVQKVAIDRRDPRHAWAASAYGVFRTRDAAHWEGPRQAGLFRYCTDILQDARDPDTLWVASDRGLFVSRNGGEEFSAALLGVAVRRVAQGGEDPGRLYVATDGHGLMVSTDGGEVFERLEGTPDVVFSVAPGPDALTIGSKGAVLVSRDGGRSWRRSRSGLAGDFYVYGIAPDPATPGRMVVSGNDGLFESTDGGASFCRLGFASALIGDVVFAPLADVPRQGPSGRPGFLRIPNGPGLGPEHRPGTDKAFERRREKVRARLTDRPLPADRWVGWFRAALEVKAGRADDAFWGEVARQLEKPRHSMFFSLPLVGFFLHCREAMPREIADRIREVMTENPIYRGDTENHWVMHYTALLLSAQTWRATPAARWFTGRTTQENYDEAKGWLDHWAGLAATRGQGEFDSPNYLFMYVTPMLLLYDFAEEREVRRLAGMMLDLLLADYFSESLEGAYCGGHSRTTDSEVERTTGNRVSILHHLYAGGIPLPEKPHGWAAFAALSSYRPPGVLAGIANLRDGAQVMTEVKRVRNVIRFSEELNPPVYKYDYMTPLYCLGSLGGGILQPIQQHTWDVTWLGSAQNSTFFVVHPSVSGRELAMFFPEDIHDLTRTIAAQKGAYVSPDKLVSASPWEKITQHENVLLALYQVPPGELFPHLNLYFPDCLEKSEEGGWVFGRDGDFRLAYHTGQKGEWTQCEGYRRFRCPADRTGFVVVTMPPGEESFETFRRRVLSTSPPHLTGAGDDLTLTYTDAGGRRHRNAWGEAAPFPAEWLYRGPFLESRVRSGVIRLTDGETVRILDFNDRTIREAR